MSQMDHTNGLVRANKTFDLCHIRVNVFATLHIFHNFVYFSDVFIGFPLRFCYFVIRSCFDFNPNFSFLVIDFQWFFVPFPFFFFFFIFFCF
ncbi:hypothetical protein BJ741DRAFT_586512 [Chytriomyces cf. hyalinus JEL632]|nr:hypothetical protein BJ741DRAFT_586512 [Chytriomyces cf. hyalinus JEL632]